MCLGEEVRYYFGLVMIVLLIAQTPFVHLLVRCFADYLAAERPPSSSANGGSGYSEGRERD